MNETKGVEAVDRALKILSCFDSDDTSLTLADLSRETGFYKSTILRLIVSLARFGYVIRGADGRYRLGSTTWRLGARYRQSFAFADLIRPILTQISETTNETASYYIREGDHRVCLYRSEPSRAIRHAITEGTSMPLGKGASGQVLRAYSQDWSDEDRPVRQAGFAISMGERDAEVAALSVPVVSASGRLLGALALSGPISRFQPARHEELLKALHSAQEQIRRDLPDSEIHDGTALPSSSHYPLTGPTSPNGD